MTQNSWSTLMASRSPYQLQPVQPVSKSILLIVLRAVPSNSISLRILPSSQRGQKTSMWTNIWHKWLLGRAGHEPMEKERCAHSMRKQHGTLTLQHGCCSLHLLWPISKTFKMDRAYVIKTTFLRLMTDWSPQSTKHLGTGKNKGMILSVPTWLLLNLPRGRTWPGQFACSPCTHTHLLSGSSLVSHKLRPTNTQGDICIGRVWQIQEWNWLFRCLGLKGICFHSSFFRLLPPHTRI